MPISSCNTPNTFMRLMNNVLHPYLYSFFIVYLDDILFYSATWEEHISHLMQVLETPKKHQLLTNLNKCEFYQQYLVQMGYVIGGCELKIDPTNMEAIIKWIVPTNCTEIRRFFGSTQYFWKFIVFFFFFSSSCTTPHNNNGK
jgi:hypothetical protein